MSFSYDTKSECAHLPVHSKIEALLELSAMARLNAAMVINRDGHHLRFFSEHPEVIGCVATLSRFLLQVEGEICAQQDDRLQKRPVYYMDLPEKATEELFAQSGVDLFGHATQSREAIFGRLGVEANARAYLRGAFFSSGFRGRPGEIVSFGSGNQKRMGRRDFSARFSDALSSCEADDARNAYGILLQRL